jgi:AcrR family transcriptional regulator
MTPRRSTRERPRRPRPQRHAHDGERREARREELLDAALRAIRRHGPRVSMEQMAAEAGVTKPILYRHVGGRQELVSLLAVRFADDLLARLGAALDSGNDPREILVAVVDRYLELIEEESELYRFLVRRVVAEQAGAQEALSALIGEIGRRVAVVIGEQLRVADLDSGPAEAWAFALVGMVQGAGDWWVDRRTVPRERLVEYLAALVWDGLGRLPLGQVAAEGAGTREER